MSRNVPGLDHVVALSDDTGIIQHATFSVPNRSTGYCTDDVARALIVTLMRMRLFPDDPHASRLASIYLSFLHDAQLEDGRFHNFMSYGRAWLDDVGTHDSCGRALWALGFAIRYAPRASWRSLCLMLFERGLQSIEWLEFPRAQAYALLGLRHAYEGQAKTGYRVASEVLARALHDRLREHADAAWYWFEEKMTYDNARLPEALLAAADVLGDGAMAEDALRSLDFLESIVFEDGRFVPIGNDGWYPRGGLRARFAQQPLEAAAMVDVELAASREPRAELAHAWYLGRNVLGAALASGGGCCDGLEPDGVNANMGAESTLAYLASAYALALRQKQAAGTR